MNRLKCCFIAGSVIGAVACALGLILIPVGDSLVGNTVRKEAVLEEGTTAYENWISAGAPVYRQFWLFDVQNPLDVLKNGSIPELQQRGPYTYRTRYIPKENVTFYQNHTASFMLPSGAIFEPSISAGAEEDMVTSLNIAVAGVYNLLNHKVAEMMINMSNSSLFQTRTVKELLWGYRDPMLKAQLGVFYPYNGTYDGPYNVFTGKDDISKVSTIDSWNHMQTLSYWNDTYCDMINGTDGSSFSPFLKKKAPLYFFSSDICRSVSAEFEGSQDLKGITVYRYMLPENTFASPIDNPDNRCYCVNNETTRNCSVAGVLDVKACKGAPVLISLPHFLHGSKELLELVHGLNPNPEEHSTYLDVEPITGFTLRFAKRLQVNMMYGPSRDIKILNKVKEDTIFPILWLNETAALDDETADMIKAALFSRIDTLEAVQIALISAGAVLLVLSLIGVCVVSRRSSLSHVA
ncbi:Platelet glycoprotein 4 [Bagarius yarrelli]|uniref:Platelet glycoprotein 4 n=1 Tax=Bagarius yarrelli TaxID=175774 RepID=A0A556V3A8_BAGYA|nr:Platelet glycoprotein 4 [Bagarius yarrelli]